MLKRFEGEVKWFNNERGYGFVHPFNDEGVLQETVEYFVHFTSIKMDGFKTLQPKQRVSFDLKDTAKGVQAIDITPIK